MAVGRTNRYLSALSGAATSRVLNLASIAVTQGQNPEYRARPLVSSPVINSSIILKHRVRADETYLFNDARLVATKIIVPFDIRDLRAGGRSFFIDERGYEDKLADVGIYSGDSAIAHDREVLRIINGLPSLDPFLLREHFRAYGVNCAECYFEISRADRQKMHDFVAGEIRKLISLALGGGGSHQSTSRLVTAMLSSEIDDKLEPLRQTLKLNGPDFQEGVFSWRGFLYYKWNMERFWPDVINVLKEIRTVHPFGAMDAERRTYLIEARRGIIGKVRESGLRISRILGVYDEAYADLVQQQQPKRFREFLLSAPHMFVELGDRMGAISHIVSFWRYRFPEKAAMTVDAEELTTIFQDFYSSFSGSDVALV